MKDEGLSQVRSVGVFSWGGRGDCRGGEEDDVAGEGDSRKVVEKVVKYVDKGKEWNRRVIQK